MGPPNGERRTGDERRRMQRRESPAGHLRNALQVLFSLSSHPAISDETFELVVSATRRVMLALWEIERRQN